MANTTQPQNAPFLRLPAELRNRIYEDALVEKEPKRITVCSRPQSHTYLKLTRWSPPGLLQTCSHIRNEASATYYGSNIFIFRESGRDALTEITELGAWLLALGEEQQAFVRHVQFYDQGFGSKRKAIRYLRGVYAEIGKQGVLIVDDLIQVSIPKINPEGDRWMGLTNLKELEESRGRRWRDGGRGSVSRVPTQS